MRHPHGVERAPRASAGPFDTSAAHVERSVENSLANLRTDRLDVLLIHRPDALMDADALAACFERLRAAGKVRHFGVSNFTPSQFALLHKRIPLVTNQIEASPLHIAPFYDGTLDQSQDVGVAPMIWSALAGGQLFTGQDDAARRVRGVLERIAGERGINVTTLVIRVAAAPPCPPAAAHRLAPARRDARGRRGARCGDRRADLVRDLGRRQRRAGALSDRRCLAPARQRRPQAPPSRAGA